ncbi:MAG: hypothetical protein ACTSQA_04745 [Candidatus Heimdallarchaeaceae archaeon]
MKKEELVKQFNETEQQITKLIMVREQIRGRLMQVEDQNKDIKKDGKMESKNK